MPDNTLLFIAGYLSAVSILAIGLTLYDKSAARRGAWRVKEITLLLVSAVGGSVAMYVVMRFARHKTKHAKFMIGIPVIIVLQIAAVLFVWWRLEGGAV